VRDYYRTVVGVVVFGLALVGAAQTGSADGQGTRRGGRRQATPNHVAAFAALEPVGSESGWGRILVRDDYRSSGSQRAVKVWVFGLEPGGQYDVEAEGVAIGTVTTDGDGDGELQLHTETEGKGVLSALPPAGDIVSAAVVDRSLAVVLEGTFSTVSQQLDDAVEYEEKITLEDVTGGFATGMACVRVKESDAQQFVTRGSRLAPGESYRILVDGYLAGAVTADVEGQAALELEHPDEENPLPAELQPVTEIRSVEWYHGEELLLAGTFLGEPECETVRGVVVEITDDGFVMEVGDRHLSVVVTEETVFREFEHLYDLDEGDAVKVEVCFRGDLLVAEWILLVEDDDEPECIETRGEVLRVGVDELLLLTGDEELVVVVNEDTLFKGFEHLRDLGDGDFVALEGCFDGEVVVAAWVMLLEAADEPDCRRFEGVFVERTDGGFVMLVGEDDRLHVVVTDQTHLWEFRELDDLDEGDLVATEGCFDGEVFVAEWVMLLEDDDKPDCAELRGKVVEVGFDEFVMLVGDDRVLVEVTDETRLEGLEHLEQLGEGDIVVVEGCWEGEALVAFWVLLVEDADEPDCAELEGTVLEVGADGFWLLVGDDEVRVVVTDETHLKEFEHLEQLGEGDLVVVEGCWEGEVLVAFWVLLVEDADAPEWWEADGTVAELYEDGFAFEADGSVIRVFVTGETEYREVDGLGGLGVGDFVFVEGPCDGESLEAAIVILIEKAE
jgi:molybdopterin-guanine dinucleotide biosynthesis protein